MDIFKQQSALGKGVYHVPGDQFDWLITQYHFSLHFLSKERQEFLLSKVPGNPGSIYVELPGEFLFTFK
jgi:hypothetical protein